MPPFRRRPGTGFGSASAPRPGPAAPGAPANPFGLVQLAQAGGYATGENSAPQRPRAYEPPPALAAAINFDAQRSTEDRANQALIRREQALMTPPSERDFVYLPLPTAMVSADDYRAIRDRIINNPNLTDQERDIFMRLLTYEGAQYDESGHSKGGITEKSWGKYKLRDAVQRLRNVEHSTAPVPQDVKDLTLDDMIDGMRAYASQEFGSGNVNAGHPLDDVSDPDLAYQLYDLQYQYGVNRRKEIWSHALDNVAMYLTQAGQSSDTLATLPSMVKLAQAKKASEGERNRLRLQAAAEIAAHPDLSKLLVRGLREAKAAWWLNNKPQEYRGSNVARIWQMTRKP